MLKCSKMPKPFLACFNGKFLAVVVFPWTISGITEERSWTTGIGLSELQPLNVGHGMAVLQLTATAHQEFRTLSSGYIRQRENSLPPHGGQESVHCIVECDSATSEGISETSWYQRSGPE